jgi:hypothetical protein
MGMSDEQKVKYIVKTMKGFGVIAVVVLNAYLIYRYVNEEEAGRMRAV